MSKKKVTVRVFLLSGSYFDIVAENVKTRYESNQLTNLEIVDAYSGLPLYVDLGAVEAVVRL